VARLDPRSLSLHPLKDQRGSPDSFRTSLDNPFQGLDSAPSGRLPRTAHAVRDSTLLEITFGHRSDADPSFIPPYIPRDPIDPDD
jgi:hypothetical protein